MNKQFVLWVTIGFGLIVLLFLTFLAGMFVGYGETMAWTK